MVSPFIQQHFRDIVDRCKGSSCAVLILVSNEPDSLCCCRILTSLLRAELVAHKVKPVRGYDDIARANDTLIVPNPDLSTIIMINCGGTVDLVDFLELDESRIVYVLDSHRPFDLMNVQDDNQQVVILNDQELVAADFPAPLTLEEEELSSSEEEDEYMHEDELEESFDFDGVLSDSSADNEMAVQRTPRRQSPRRRKRLRTHLSEEEYFQLRQSRRLKKHRIQQYYRASYYGQAASRVCFLLAHQLGKASLNVLWLCIVGVTDQLINERIDEGRYNQFLGWAADELKHFTPDSEGSGEDGAEPPPQTGQVQLHKEYRFMLLRHWNLYESMYNSKYVATRLGIWKDGGKRKLKLLLSKVGIPLKECRAAFRTMGKEYRKALEEGLTAEAEQYSLPSLTFDSFTRQHGSNFRVSAADITHSLAALLENPSDNDDGLAWERNFWVAYDAVSYDNLTALKQGLRMSVLGQKAIVKQAVALLKKKSIVSSGPFRYAYIEDSADQALFCHPLILSKLGLFLVDAVMTTSSNRIAKPLVLACYNPSESNYLVVGVPGPSIHGSGRILNPFGVAFREAAERTRAHFKHDSFEASVMEVAKDDIHNFFELLHSDLIPM